MKPVLVSVRPAHHIGVFWRAGLRFDREPQRFDVGDATLAALRAEPMLTVIEMDAPEPEPEKPVRVRKPPAKRTATKGRKR